MAGSRLSDRWTKNAKYADKIGSASSSNSSSSSTSSSGSSAATADKMTVMKGLIKRETHLKHLNKFWYALCGSLRVVACHTMARGVAWHCVTFYHNDAVVPCCSALYGYT